MRSFKSLYMILSRQAIDNEKYRDMAVRISKRIAIFLWTNKCSCGNVKSKDRLSGNE